MNCIDNLLFQHGVSFCLSCSRVSDAFDLFVQLFYALNLFENKVNEDNLFVHACIVTINSAQES